jgi:hypothetical protein
MSVSLSNYCNAIICGYFPPSSSLDIFAICLKAENAGLDQQEIQNKTADLGFTLVRLRLRPI